MEEVPTPGAEFYFECLARALAVPEEERSQDVRQWLRCNDVLEAAFALLPRAEPGTTLSAPAGGKPALAARCCACWRLPAATPRWTLSTPSPRCGGLGRSCRR